MSGQILGSATSPAKGPAATGRLRLRLLVLLFASTLSPALTLSPQAIAGIYEVKSCSTESALPFHGQFERYGANRVDVVQNCDRQARGWIGIYQTRKGTAFADGEGAGYRWFAPSGAAFVRSRVYAKLKNANGIAAQIYATDPSGGYYGLDSNTAHDGVERQLYVDIAGSPRAQLAVRLACLTKPPCSNRATDVKAFFEVRHLSFWLRDTVAPQVSISGGLFDQARTGTPHRGIGQLRYQAKDAGGGLKEAYAEINGNVTSLAAYSCPGARNGFAERTQPCPAEETRTATFDTTEPPFGDGFNLVRICARDYATEGVANAGCSGSIGIVVDNRAPAAPQDLTVAGGEDWRAENEFDVGWINPGAQTTPVVAAHYRIYDAETGLLATPERTVDARNIAALKDIQVPRPGHFRIEVQVRDEAGNLGPPATAYLRFDDRRPGSVALADDLGWVGARDLPLRLGVALPPAAGPSGILGIVHSLRGDAAGGAGTSPEAEEWAGETLCPSGNCRGEEISPPAANGGTSLELGRLTEGRYRLGLAAVSGAWLRSAAPQTATFAVDLTDPKAALAGVPASWSRTPVLVTAEARDGGSGMAPSSPGNAPPITVIELSGKPRVEQVGDRASLLISGEGTHRLRYWARDLAGNANDGRRLANGHRHDPPGEASIRIDWTPPKVTFLESPADDPELVRAVVADAHSGVARGQIHFRPLSGTGGTGASGGYAATGFTQLPTTLASGELRARLPSDDLPPGKYELRATAWDRAGNGYDADGGGSATKVISLPLKATPAVDLWIAGARTPRVVLPPAAGAVVAGNARDAGGRPLSGSSLQLVERFDHGSALPERVTGLVTAADGSFRANLRPGPSRRIIARFPGNRHLARVDSAPVRLAWPARVRLRVSPQISRNGEAVRMRGRIRGPGARIPAEGKLVAIQFLDVGRRRWRPVDLLRTDARGRFRFDYRFRTVSSPQRFSFRAVAPAESGWPYRPARSGKNAVVVYPR